MSKIIVHKRPELQTLLETDEFSGSIYVTGEKTTLVIEVNNFDKTILIYDKTSSKIIYELGFPQKVY